VLFFLDVNIIMIQIKCAWSLTQESFLIEADHDDFATWFVETCDKHGNDFKPSGMVNDIQCSFVSESVTQLKSNINVVNDFLNKIKEPILSIPDDIEHQSSLNRLHKDWVRVHRNKPNVDTLMYKINPTIFEAFHDINRLVHAIESSFVYQIRSTNLWRVENPFSLCEDWNEHNVSVCYTDFGKNSFDKWQSRDSDPNDIELSQWNCIGGSLRIELNQPRPRSAPTAYIEYCQKHSIQPVVPTWPLGNLVDIDSNLGKVRRMFDRNLQIKDNFLRFDLA